MLDTFIVLGLVPGTQLQITFTTWIVVSITLISGISLWRSYRSEMLQRLIITSDIIFQTHLPLQERWISL
jgi:hypothetical protein